MNIKIFKGKFFELGQQQGRIYRANGMTFDKVKIDSLLYKNQLKIYEKHYPEFLEELRGMADGGNFDRKKLIYDFITSEVFYYKNRFKLDKACTIFGYKTKNNLFVGRNYDWLPITEKVFKVYMVINPLRNSFIAVTDMGINSPTNAKPQYLLYKADDVINDKGLFIGLTFAYTNQWSYGISCIHIIKLIAETCKTVADALKVFKRVPLCGPKNFFIADQNGDMAVIEHTSKRFRVLYPKNDILIQTNHFVDPSLAKEDTVLQHVPTHNTFKRYNETLTNINSEKDKFEFNSITKILNKKNSYTCQNLTNVKTIWTLGLDMINKKYKIYWNLFGKRKSKSLAI